MILNSLVCDEYICTKVNSILGSDGIRLNVKPIQVLKTTVIACLACVSNLTELSTVKSILAKVCKDAENAMTAQGRHREYEGSPFPEMVLSRSPMGEPDVPGKYKTKGMTDEYRRLRMVINVEIEADNARRVNSVMHIVEKSRVLKKMLGYLTKLLPMGPFGPRIDDHDAQCDRAQDGKVNTMFHCFTTGVFITGLTSPNQKFHQESS